VGKGWSKILSLYGTKGYAAPPVVVDPSREGPEDPPLQFCGMIATVMLSLCRADLTLMGLSVGSWRQCAQFAYEGIE